MPPARFPPAGQNDRAAHPSGAGQRRKRKSAQIPANTDATIISAPPSTKNKGKSRDPDMHQTKKGNQWYFGMKAHIGVDSQTKVIHAVAATAANVHDSVCLPDLLHGEETVVWGDSAYQGQAKLSEDMPPRRKTSPTAATVTRIP